MIELSNERIEQILFEETAKNADLKTILRSIYFRYMRVFEQYFENTDELDDSKIKELNEYHEETKRLIRYYYLDIPMDICEALKKLESNYTEKLLGDSWREFLSEKLEEFREEKARQIGDEETLKAEFKKHSLKEFYDAMGYVFREGFGTGSKSAESMLKGISEIFFEKKK